MICHKTKPKSAQCLYGRAGTKLFKKLNYELWKSVTCSFMGSTQSSDRNKKSD